MRLVFNELLILSWIVIALALPGAHGVSFSGANCGESISANVHASTASAAGITYGRGDFHSYGDGDAKYSRKYSTGSTWSQVGYEIKDADNYDGHIGGSKDAKAKTTSAYLDLLAEGAEYIHAYGKSGTTKNIGSGVEMIVEDGDADISIKTQANGKAVTSESSLDTNADGDGLDIIRGSRIGIKGYYTSNKGELKAKIGDGSIEGYHLWTGCSRGGSRAEQSAESAFGDLIKFTTYTKEAIPGKTREMTASTSITDGYVSGYHSNIDDHARVMSHSASQGFDEAGAREEVAAETTYIETTKSAKKYAEESAQVSDGFMISYSSGAVDAYPYRSPGASQNAEYAEGNNIYFDNHYIEVSKKASRQTYAETIIYSGLAENFRGESQSSDESGTEHSIDLAQGMNIILDNRYEDNLRAKGGSGSANVILSDPAAYGGEDLTGSLTDYVGKAEFATTDAGTTMDVRAQGHTDRLDVESSALAHYNQRTSDQYGAGDWENYFIAEAKSAGLWEISAISGRQVAVDESIQQAINTMTDAEDNIFLLPGTYSENWINNNEAGEKSFALWGAGSYLEGEGNTVLDATGLLDGSIFSLYANTADQAFTFKNIDFNNAKSTSMGGAILINNLGAGVTATVNIENSNFNNNQATAGGAIYNRYGTLNIKDCAFNGNHVTGSGGAIVNFQGAATIENSDFTSNYAAVGGGALSQADAPSGAIKAEMTLNGCAFIGNHADGGDGGAIRNSYIGNSPSSPTITADGCTFKDNTAAGNGGAYAATNFAAAPGTANTITNSDFQSNAAGGKGNAIYVKTPATNTFAFNTYGPGQNIVIEP